MLLALQCGSYLQQVFLLQITLTVVLVTFCLLCTEFKVIITVWICLSYTCGQIIEVVICWDLYFRILFFQVLNSNSTLAIKINNHVRVYVEKSPDSFIALKSYHVVLNVDYFELTELGHLYLFCC